MDNDLPRTFTTRVVPRVIDLRSEFEAQLRSVARLDEQLKKTLAGKDREHRDLSAVLRRELTAMLINNKHIRDVLTDLEGEISPPAPVRS